jgi:hypothetical protein
MPAYLTQPASAANRRLLVPGRPEYVFGSRDGKSSDTLSYVTNASLTTNVATLTLKLAAGNVPIVGQLLTMLNCSDSTFNVTGAAITAVAGFNTGDNSTGTVSFALTHANVGSEAVSGYVFMPVPEIAEALVNGASIQVSVPFNDPRIDQSRTITAQMQYPSIPTTCTTTLQTSDDDINYFDVGTVASVSGGVVTGGLLQAQNLSSRYYRLNHSNVTGGTSPTCVGKISA